MTIALLNDNAYYDKNQNIRCFSMNKLWNYPSLNKNIGGMGTPRTTPPILFYNT